MAENYTNVQDPTETLEAFRNWLIAGKGLALNTAANHIGFIKRHIGKLGLNPSESDVYRFIVEIRGTCSYSHLVNTIAAIERYMEFIGRPLRLKRPHKPKTLLKDTLSEADIVLIIASCRTLRDRAIVSLLAYSGIRNAELCRLKVKDVDLTSGVVHVLAGKNEQDYDACITAGCADLISQYVNQESSTSEDLLFRTARRENELEPQDLRKLVRRIATRAGITKRVHPHLFRHSLAVNMLNRGANIMTIRNQLGHAYLMTTVECYLRGEYKRTKHEYQLCAPSYL